MPFDIHVCLHARLYQSHHTLKVLGRGGEVGMETLGQHDANNT